MLGSHITEEEVNKRMSEDKTTAAAAVEYREKHDYPFQISLSRK